MEDDSSPSLQQVCSLAAKQGGFFILIFAFRPKECIIDIE